MPNRRRGFVLVFVLWVVVSASALAMALSGIGRGELALMANRDLATRAQWTVLGCLDRLRAQAEDQIWSDGYTPSSVQAAWEELDRLVSPSRDCLLDMRPAGLSIDASSASHHQLRRLFLTLGMKQERADSLAAAIIDWRDADDQTVDGESEAAWYRNQGRIPPRNRPFADVAELGLVRGIDAALARSGILSVRPEPILWRRAEPAVLATLPGMTDEALVVLAAHNRSDLSSLTLLVDFPELPTAARDSLARASRALLPLLAAHVETWTAVAKPAVDGVHYIRASLTLGLRSGRLEILERRLLP